ANAPLHHDHEPGHDDGHGRGHGHGHGHDHARGGHRHHHHHHHHHPAPDRMGRAFAIGIVLNSVFVAAEVAAGVWAGSLALLADAGHKPSGVPALILAWGAAALARRAPTARRT